MKNLKAALWAEMMKIKCSRVLLFSILGFSMVPLVGGLFMIILKDPEAAQSMGLVSMKAEIMIGTAEWAALFDMLSQAVAIGGMVIFGIITAWCFGREFSDHTVKDLLALPTPRKSVVTAKFIVVAVWSLSLTILILALGLLVGYLVDIPGWSSSLLQSSVVTILGAGLLTIGLLPFAAFTAGIGRGYLPSIGLMLLMVICSQVVIFTGWGEYFPWAIPAIFSGAAGARGELLEPHSYVIMVIASLIGAGLTYWWWNHADQAG